MYHKIRDSLEPRRQLEPHHLILSTFTAFGTSMEGAEALGLSRTSLYY